MRVGEILLKHGWVSEDDLASAVADQAIAGKRLCSLLIVRGVIEADQAHRALAEQFGVSAALMKHLDNRDRALAKELPTNIARAHFALPLGRMRDGEIVICVRDPKPHSQEAFEQFLKTPVLITVAAAHSLEPLIDLTYPPPRVTGEMSVRFARPSSQPANTSETPQSKPPPPQSFAAGTVRGVDANLDVDVDVDIDVDTGNDDFDSSQTPIPETFTIVDLDDAGVEKDYSHFDSKTPTSLPPGVGAAPRPSTLPPLNTGKTPSKKP
jgi:hypothetical protein